MFGRIKIWILNRLPTEVIIHELWTRPDHHLTRLQSHHRFKIETHSGKTELSGVSGYGPGYILVVSKIEN